MKSFIALSLRWLGHLCSILLPYHRYKTVFEYIKITFYTSWISPSFKQFGVDSSIRPSFSRLKGAKYITVGRNTFIDSNVQLTAWDSYFGQSFTPEIIIGNNCSIGEDSHITAINSIRLGNNVRMGKKILITDNAHGTSDVESLDIAPNFRPLHTKGPVWINDNVWIGEKSSIMPGVCIGKGCIIAANSVVTKNIPDYCVVAGVPAKIIKQLR